MALDTNFPGLSRLPPEKWDMHWAMQVYIALNNILTGKMNCTGEVTLTANAASTVVTDTRVGGPSVILLMPRTANAAAELGAGTAYIATVGKQTFTITHANNAQNDRTYRYAVIG